MKFNAKVLPYLFIIILLLGSAFACNLPLLPTQPTPLPFTTIVWQTNTPELVEASITQVAETLEPEATDTLQQPGPITVTPQPDSLNTAPYLYYSQAGDTLEALSIRFSVLPEEITSPDNVPLTGMIDPDQLLIVPRRLYNTTIPQHILPDSELVYSPSAVNFDVQAFVDQAGGQLKGYRDYLGSTGWTSGADIVARVALENSINPRVLLSLLEYQSGMVYGETQNPDYAMGHREAKYKGLYKQLVWAVNQLSIGYYGWREGRLTDVVFSDRVSARLAPDLNAGTAAIHYYFSRQYNSTLWLEAINAENGWPALHEQMFGSPWIRAQAAEPLFPPFLSQPRLILPFLIGQIWAYTGGPHGAWEKDGSYAALDFAPASTESGCVKSDQWVVAAAPGLVVRSERGVIVLDLDGDGKEQTGWSLVYLHISSNGRAPVGTWVTETDLLGHPSCEGGVATGTHIHIARKYNGEWIAADGPMPFNLSGWVAEAGIRPYEGSLIRNGDVIDSSIYGIFESRISRDRNDP